MDAPPPAFPDVRQLTGPNMIGYQLGSALYGVFCLQVFLYWTRYPLDRRWLKIFVAFLLFLETAHTVLNLIGSWYTYGPGFGQLSTLYGILPWSAAAPPIVAAFLTSYVHTFYAHRIWRLTGQWGISVVIMLFTLTQLGFSLAAAIANIGITFSAATLAMLRNLVTVFLLCVLLADIIITSTLVYALREASKDVIPGRTTNLVSRVINVAIHTGIITTLAATIHLGLYYQRGTLWYFIPYSISTKLYSNTVMASLNTRPTLRSIGESSTQYESRFFWKDMIDEELAAMNFRSSVRHENSNEVGQESHVLEIRRRHSCGSWHSDRSEIANERSESRSRSSLTARDVDK